MFLVYLYPAKKKYIQISYIFSERRSRGNCIFNTHYYNVIYEFVTYSYVFSCILYMYIIYMNIIILNYAVLCCSQYVPTYRYNKDIIILSAYRSINVQRISMRNMPCENPPTKFNFTTYILFVYTYDISSSSYSVSSMSTRRLLLYTSYFFLTKYFCNIC